MLENPKHEQFAHLVLAKPSVTQAYAETYQTTPELAHKNAHRLTANEGVRNRIQEILEGKGMTDEYLLNFGREKFLLGEDQNIAHKAWRTFLEIKGIINADQAVNIANIVFNEQIVQPAPIPQDVVSVNCTSDNPV